METRKTNWPKIVGPDALHREFLDMFLSYNVWQMLEEEGNAHPTQSEYHERAERLLLELTPQWYALHPETHPDYSQETKKPRNQETKTAEAVEECEAVAVDPQECEAVEEVASDSEPRNQETKEPRNKDAEKLAEMAVIQPEIVQAVECTPEPENAPETDNNKQQQRKPRKPRKPRQPKAEQQDLFSDIAPDQPRTTGARILSALATVAAVVDTAVKIMTTVACAAILLLVGSKP